MPSLSSARVNAISDEPTEIAQFNRMVCSGLYTDVLKQLSPMSMVNPKQRKGVLLILARSASKVKCL